MKKLKHAICVNAETLDSATRIFAQAESKAAELIDQAAQKGLFMTKIPQYPGLYLVDLDRLAEQLRQLGYAVCKANRDEQPHMLVSWRLPREPLSPTEPFNPA